MHFGVPLLVLIREAFRDFYVSPPRMTECHRFPQKRAAMRQNFSEMPANPRSVGESFLQNHGPEVLSR